MSEQNQPYCNEDEWCGECDEPILPGELRVKYDGEPCHIGCAAEARDEAGFDNWFINREELTK